MNRMKKTLALILCFVMCLSLLPMQAVADSADDITFVEESQKEQITVIEESIDEINSFSDPCDNILTDEIDVKTYFDDEADIKIATYEETEPDDNYRTIIFGDAPCALSANEITQQIKNTYSEALKKSGRSSFNGYCGSYVNWQLKILGINTAYVSGNGKDEFDNYKNLKKTTGGYPVTAYPASSYSLSTALNSISANGTRNVYNVLVGFEKGSSSTNGQKYGHTCFIHAIIDGKIYYSESFKAKIGGTTYSEGTPIVCSISTFCNYYGSWSKAQLDGVIYFGNSENIEPSIVINDAVYPSGTIEYGKKFGLRGTITSSHILSEVYAAVINTNTDQPVNGFEYSNNPQSTSYDIKTGGLNNAFKFAELPAGNYRYLVKAKNTAGLEKTLINETFKCGNADFSQINLHHWVSRTAMGEGSSGYVQGDYIYYCYELRDAVNLSPINNLTDDIDYTIKLEAYNPDSTLIYSYTYTNTDSGWIGFKLKQAGTTRLILTLNGSVEGNYFEYSNGPVVEVAENPTTIMVSEETLELKVGEKQTVNVELGGYYDGNRSFRWEKDSNIVSCSWGTVENHCAPLTITALSAGTATITCSIIDSETEEYLASAEIAVTVIEDTYYLDLNGLLDGKNVNNIDGYGTADIYINGNLVAEEVTDFYRAYPSGTRYWIRNIKANEGFEYNGVAENSASINGVLGAESISVILAFSTTKLNVIYNSNGATTIKLFGEEVSEDTLTNFPQVKNYSESVPDGLWDGNNPDWLYLERTGYEMATQSWNTKADGTGTSIKWNQSFGTAADLAEALGVDLSTGSKTVTVYMEWEAEQCVPGEPVIENEVAATCETEGGYDTVIYCAVCGKELSREHTVIPATGHDWNTPTYTWTTDNSKVTATRVCKNDTIHVETETVNTTYVVMPLASCEEEGIITYTASFTNPAFETQTKTEVIPAFGHTPGESIIENEIEATCDTEGGYDTVVYCIFCAKELSREHMSIPATGHDWAAPTYVWSYDNSTVTATRVCKHDASHVETETVNTTYEVITEPTTESEGLGCYTAVFENSAFEKQVKTVSIPMIPTPTESLTLSLSSESAKPGDNVTVALELNDNPGIMFLQLKFDYDTTRLENLSFSEGDTLSGWQFGTGASWGGTKDETGNGTLLLLNFKVKDDAPEGEAYVRVSEAEAFNESEQEIAVNAVAGKVNVVYRTPGDATDDGKVNGLDAIRIQKYLAGQNVSINLSNADVTGDGKVNGLDYIRLMKYFAGQNVELLGGSDGKAAQQSLEITNSDAAQGSISLRPTEDRVSPGDTLEIKVQIEDNPGIMFLQLKFDYDSSVFEAPEFTDAGSGWQFGTGAAWGGTKDEAFTGDVFTMKLKAKEDAPTGETEIRISSAEAFNENEEEVAFSLANATVTVGEPPAEGYAVAVTDKTKGAATASISAGSYSGETTFTVSSKDDLAVLVAVKTAEGYEPLTCTTDEAGVHHFTVNVTADTEIVLALKGDVNLDGAVKLKDNLMVKKHIARSELITDEFALLVANVDGSENGVKLKDNLMLKKQIARSEFIPW